MVGGGSRPNERHEKIGIDGQISSISIILRLCTATDLALPTSATLRTWGLESTMKGNKSTLTLSSIFFSLFSFVIRPDISIEPRSKPV
jgi:hypothetical protein